MSDRRLNPLGIASALFLIAAPFLTWITIVSVVIYQGFVVFGAAAQSNLVMVSAQQSGMAISQVAVLGSTASVLLIPLGGIAMLKSAKLGVPIALAGLFSYLLPMYSSFGTQASGYQLTFVSPGVGLFVATAGVLVGSVSPLVKPSSPGSFAKALTTRQGLSGLGVFAGAVGLSLDILNHAALGQLTDFIGFGLTVQFLHLGLLAGTGAMVLISLVGSGRQRERYLFAASFATLSLLGGDFAYSTVAGSLNDFLGHNLTETSLHFMVYYGIALTLVSRLGRPSSHSDPSPQSGTLLLPSL